MFVRLKQSSRKQGAVSHDRVQATWASFCPLWVGSSSVATRVVNLASAYQQSEGKCEYVHDLSLVDSSSLDVSGSHFIS